MMFKNAIVRTPAASLIDGLTSATLGKPNYQLALTQHQKYVRALEHCGVEVTVLPALEHYPDSCFVEDVALVTTDLAILTHPGAPSRRGEVPEIASAISRFYKNQVKIMTPEGNLDAGDVLRVENHFFIGLSARTNLAGAAQLRPILQEHGHTVSTIPLQHFLHLKTGVSYLEQGTLLVTGELDQHPCFAPWQQLSIDEDEFYAANCIAVNGTVLLAQGFPKTKDKIRQLGLPIIELDMSEFRKVDGGLSCLSLRF